MKTDVAFAYRRSAGHNASPVRLVIILYEQLIKDLRRALSAMERNDIETRTREVDHALLVLARLQGTLDKERGGKVSDNLNQFYDLLRHTLLTAPMKGTPQILSKQISNLLQLREAWVEVERTSLRPSDEEDAPSVPNAGAGVERSEPWRA